MLPNLQAYHRPDSLEEALRLIRQPGTVPLGGGTHLLPGRDPSVEAVVDLSGLGLSSIEGKPDRVSVGATVTLQRLVESAELADLTRGWVREVVPLVASRNLRGQATVGGMLACGEADHPLLVLLLALGASLTLWAPERRTVGLESFLAYRRRLLTGGGLITELEIPRPVGTVGLGFAYVGRTPKDRPIVCVASFLRMEEGICQEVRLALGGVAERPLRAARAEQYLLGKAVSVEQAEEAAALAARPLAPPTDFRGSGEYRRAMAEVLVRRALLMAKARVGAG
ncbi:MAG TPA: hypothetical protein EYH27_04065 [Anaerolineales bacterium]|nr:hypothetical protein [Anaerolineales bacterium]